MKVSGSQQLAKLAGLIALTACALPPGVGSEHVVLRGFSDSNYVSLDKALGNSMCLTGRLSVDTAGIYFALQPIRRDGMIDTGFSRVRTDLSYQDAERSRIKDLQTHTVCGVLEDATPFKGCDYEECKWYRLKGAKLRK